MSADPTLFDVDDYDPEPVSHGQRVALTVAYDGTSFHGFAPNPGVVTVGGSLVDALSTVVRHRVELTCAGRTDKGVHARGQVVDFVVPVGTDLDALVRAVNSLCGPDIAVRDPRIVPQDFSARFDAVARRYRYRIHNDEIPDPFSTASAWHVKEPLNLARLRLACDPFIGTHDFSSFCRRATAADGTPKSAVRDVTDARWDVDGHRLTLWIEASSFCHQMVRSVVGTMVQAGLGRLSPGDIAGIIAARDRSAAGPVAPPHGLTLWSVSYPSEPRLRPEGRWP